MTNPPAASPVDELVEKDDFSWLVRSLLEQCECQRELGFHEVCDWCQGVSAIERAAALLLSQQERIGELEAQDEIHWKTRRTLLAERDALKAVLESLSTPHCILCGCKKHLDDCVIGKALAAQEKP